MQLIKSTVDTRRNNGVIGNVNMYDDVTLELQVVCADEPLDAWVSPIIELHCKKKDGTGIRQIDNIDVIDGETNKIRIKLHEQAVVIAGSVKLQLVIKEGSRTSTTIFYINVAKSLENDFIESHDYIRAFEDFDEYIERVKAYEVAMDEKTSEVNKRLEQAQPISRATACFSIYSVISSRIMASRLPNISSARHRHSSVFPTPVGPANIRQAMGRFSSRMPE